MTSFTTETFERALAETPAIIVDFANSDATAATITRLAQRYSLLKRSGTIAATCGYILIGLIPVRMLQETLRKELAINDSVVLQLAQDIRREILAPVAHDLAALQPTAEQNYAMAQQAGQNQPQTVAPAQPQFPQTPPQPPSA